MVAIPWKFESSYAHHIMLKGKFWGCSSVGRALRSQCRGREFESHQLHHEFSLSRAKKRTIKKIQCLAVVSGANEGGLAVFADAKSQRRAMKKHYYTQSWGYGGMVDAEDLKSFDHCDRVGSSPTIPTIRFRLRYSETGPAWRRWRVRETDVSL